MAKKSKAAPLWRAPFLRALRRTGNARASAREAGVDHGTPYNHRLKDKRFAGQWERALAKRKSAPVRAKGPLHQPTAGPPPRPGEELVVRISKRSGAQLVKAGKGRWSAKAERAFLASLGETGCIRRAARAAGFSTTAIHNRLNNYPGFAEAAQAAIRQARADLESMVLSAGIATFDPAAADEDDTRPRVTVAEAIAFLKLNPSAKGAGAAKAIEEPSIEEVRDEVLRRIAAIKRHREGGGGEAEA
ncbi:MAG TPA: hypothetical protein VF662_03340 [Allosphingosinicella sp.]|jgi:hypothetical protein